MLKTKKLLSFLLAMLLVINVSAVGVVAAAPGDPEALNASVELVVGRYDSATKVFTPLAIGEEVLKDELIAVRIVPQSNYLVGISSYVVMFDKALFTLMGNNNTAFIPNTDNTYFNSASIGLSGVANLPPQAWPDSFLTDENNDTYQALKVFTRVGTATNPQVLPGEWLFQFRLKAKADLTVGTDARIWTDARWFRSSSNSAAEGYISKCLTGENSNNAQTNYDFIFDFDNADVKIPLVEPVAKSSIFFNTDGGSPITRIREEVGTTVTPPQPPTKTGYNFDGWEPELPAIFPAEDLTVKALWTIKQSTILFDANGGSTIDPQVGDYGTPVTTPTTPVREGYTFNGWQPAVPTTFPENNLTVTAQWTVNRVTITFDSAGGSAVTPKVGNFGTPLAPPFPPTKSGFAFDGWDPVLPTTFPAESLTLTAKWVKRIKITFDSNGGSPRPPQTGNEGATLVPPTEPTKIGHAFTGWSPSLPPVYPSEDFTVTATWELKETTITFFTDGGTVIGSMTGEYGTPVTAPADPEKAGYDFNGWGPALPATFPAEDLTVTAQWTAIVYYINMTYNGEVVEGNSLKITVPWLKMYGRVKVQLGYETNMENPARVEYLSSKPNVIVNQHGKVTNQGFFVRSSDITINAYDADDNLIATSTTNVLFYKTIIEVFMEKITAFIELIMPLFQK